MFLVELYDRLVPHSLSDKNKSSANVEISYSSDIEVIFGFKPSMSRDLGINIRTLSTPELNSNGLKVGAPQSTLKPLHGAATLPSSGFEGFNFTVEYYLDNLHLNYRFHVEWWMATHGGDSILSDIMTHSTFNIFDNHGEVSNIIDCGYVYPLSVSALMYDTTLNMQRESTFKVEYAASNFNIKNPRINIDC